MTSEQLPPDADPLDSTMLDGRSLREWHEWLTHDQSTGEYTGDLQTPGSRYGRTAAACGWWALALECVIVDATGMDDLVAETSIEYSMSLAVNNHDDVAELVGDNLHTVPECIKAKLRGDI